ncbi:MAG: 1-(5-phosphoribosyl)-5-[(5-phosphoribosylamino)methylideneamino]imidazole-4-carboxamide isomerase [Clostridia bacterium]|nr:1-(5-phosphoribosyl)-5-[(5-phosphoribosylamino)methylideneamino]imidazole-4-carboxamide isomerase [Clostridia bacterium]
MKIFPAIDLYEGKAVRLLKGNYNAVTVYSENPIEIAKDFENSGATELHTVDLEGARDGGTPNIEIIKSFVENTKLNVEVGGGIRSMDTVKAYLDAGVRRVILGTAAVTDPEFLKETVDTYGDKIAVGADIKDGKVAIKGWVEKSEYSTFEFFEMLRKIGVSTVICTDISKDGAMQGTNRELYKELSQRFSVNIIASGGVSSLDDIKALNEMDLFGAIIGKAYYTGAIKINEALEVTK